MERIQFIEHRGTKVLRLDFTHTNADEVPTIIRDAKKLIAAQPEKSLRTLTDVTGMKFNAEAAEAFKEFASHNKPYVLAGAVLGITGLKQIIYNAVLKFSGRHIAAFDTETEAKDWLAQQ